MTILGVPAVDRDTPVVEESADRIEQTLEKEAAEVKTVVRPGEPSAELLEEVKDGRYDLVIVARQLHRQARLRLRSTTHQLARHIPAHLLIARDVPERLGAILICSGAEAPSAETVRLAGLLTAGSGAEVGLLHVMSQVALRPDSPSEDLEESAEEAIQRRTHEGDHLQQAIESLRKEGVGTEIRPILRHGLVVEEVLAEIEEGEYDLLVLGSHRQPAMNRWLDVLLDDVTGELLTRSPISTLVIYQQEANTDELGQ